MERADCGMWLFGIRIGDRNRGMGVMSIPARSVLEVSPDGWRETVVTCVDLETGKTQYVRFLSQSIRYATTAAEMNAALEDLQRRVEVGRGMPDEDAMRDRFPRVKDGVAKEAEYAKWLRLMFPETKDAGVA